jgi:hypothetical protein
MYIANKEKFTQNKDLTETLINTTGIVDFGVGFWPRWNKNPSLTP